MQPDVATPETVSQEALGLWTKLSGLYDEIEASLREERAHEDLATLGRAIVEVEGALRPLVARIGEIRAETARPSARLRATWDQSDALIASLAERQPTLTRAALAAREGAARALAKVRSVRLDSGAYRQAPKSEPRFASRQA